MFPSGIDVPLVMAILFFLVVCLLSIGIMIHYNRLKQHHAMLEKISTADNDWNAFVENRPADLDLGKKSTSSIMRILSLIGVKANPKSADGDGDIHLKFLKAGIRGKNAPTVFWGTKILFAVLLPMIFLVITTIFIKAIDATHVMYATIWLTLIGLFLPNYWLRMKTAKRKEAIGKAFPDALDLLVVCVEAGMGLDSALHRVGKEMTLSSPELSDEFKFLNLELRAGKSRQAALRNLARRTDVDDVNSLVTLLIQTDRFGTSIAQALRVFSESFRTARYQKAEEFAAKIGTKLIFPLVLFIFPSMLIVMLGPVAIQVYRTFYG